MATFDYVAWGTTKIIGKWVLEGTPSPSGIYRGQCTQVVTQLLKDLGYSGWNAARGNGSQVGSTMVVRGEAVYVGTNLSSIPSGEIHIVCKDVGTGLDGHVSVAAAGDTIYEQNVRNNQPTRNFGIGSTYSGRLGRLAEAFRGTRYHYKLTVATDFDNVGGDGGSDPPDDDPGGPNQNRYLRTRVVDVKKTKTNPLFSIENHKNFQLVARTTRDVGQN